MNGPWLAMPAAVRVDRREELRSRGNKVLSAKEFKRVSMHSEYAIYTVRRCIGGSPGGSSERKARKKTTLGIVERGQWSRSPCIYGESCSRQTTILNSGTAADT